jgi:transcriptional regulator with XRE-family HTH domain
LKGVGLKVLGENIKKIREAKNIGVNELARRSGVTSAYISEIEHGKKANPSQSIISSIAAALDFPVSLFYSDLSTIDNVVKELYKISDFTGNIENCSENEKIDILTDALTQDLSLFTELDKFTQHKILEACKKPDIKYLSEPLTPDEYAAVSAFLQTFSDMKNSK